MKELKCTKTIEEITGYEADDGTRFKTKEECERYEQSAYCAVWNSFRSLFVGAEFEECRFFDNFGYGSEEFMYAIVEIKNANDVITANMFSKLTASSAHVTWSNEDIGKKFLCGLGYCWEKKKGICSKRSADDLRTELNKVIDKFFNPVKEGDTE